MNQTIRLEEYAKKESRLKAFLSKYGMAVLFLGVFLACFITFFVVPLFYGIHISLTNFKYDHQEEKHGIISDITRCSLIQNSNH